MEQSSADVWPKRPGLVVHHGEAGPTAETMSWGFARTMPGKRPGTAVTKNVTNVRNLTSPYWRSMLANPEQRCLGPFSQFDEPKMGQGRKSRVLFASRKRLVYRPSCARALSGDQSAHPFVPVLKSTERSHQ